MDAVPTPNGHDLRAHDGYHKVMNDQTRQYLKQYALSVRNLLRVNPNASEPALAPSFQELVKNLLPLLDAVPTLTVAPEFEKKGVGRPDIALIKQGQPPRAFVELKAPSKDANPERWKGTHDKRQYERLKELGRWSSSNFIEFHLFSLGERLGHAVIVPAKALKPETADKTADKIIDDHDAGQFLELLAVLARADAPTARDDRHLAELLAHAARIVRSAVEERVADLREAGSNNDPLMMVRNTFKDVLYAHPEAGGYAASDFDSLFASAFAQTLAFGLLLVREHLAATETDEDKQLVGDDAWKHMPDEHPLMKAALRVLSDDEVTSQIGIGFDVMRDCVNSFAPEILALREDGSDPIITFYEFFLAIFDPAARERYGVYYTPIEVVRYMVGAMDRALSENLGTEGLRDKDVTILDPATGTGTFLLGIAERVRDQVMAEEGGKAATLALRNLAGRMFGFELLVGPYAVAHYRLHHALRYRPADDDEDAPQPVKLPRLGVYLADTLSEPGMMTPEGKLGIPGIPIDDERARANDVKEKQRILAIIGNPPYKRLAEGENETLVGRWMDEKWEDLKKPVKNAGKGGQLNTFPEFSVAFWRWAIWKLFEAENAPKKGVIAFITNRKFLTGWPYAGLRKMMREQFDRIEVIDLRGDVNAGPRGDVEDDQGVFNITVGTCITLAIADGSKQEGALADVCYFDSWSEQLYKRAAKFAWLTGNAQHGKAGEDQLVAITRPLLDDFRPAPFQNGEWLSIREAFSFSKSGMKSGNDNAFVAVDSAKLRTQVAPILQNHVDKNFDENLVRRLAYRPLDSRNLYNDLPLLNRPGPDMQKSWGDANVGLYSLKSNTGAGPATWCHGLLPDYHSIRGSNGGYAFPLYDRRKGPSEHNLNPALLTALAEAYGLPVKATDVFDAILCLLSAQSYTKRFAEDLEDVFPHVPFPASHTTFAEAARIGAEIRAIEAFQRPTAPAFRPKAFCKLALDLTGAEIIDEVSWENGTLSLWRDEDKAVAIATGLPAAVWQFSISGYRVLPRWIEGRKGLSVEACWPELRDVAARIHELIHWFGEADLALEATLADTLTREELGFPAAEAQEATESDD
ncbi:MAG: type ISP restriction/modification enzyme [Novosphingobium sp.]